MPEASSEGEIVSSSRVRVESHSSTPGLKLALQTGGHSPVSPSSGFQFQAVVMPSVSLVLSLVSATGTDISVPLTGCFLVGNMEVFMLTNTH